MRRAIGVSGFILLASLVVVAQATMSTQAAPSAPTSTRTAPAATTPAPGNPGQTTGTTPTNTPQLTDTIGQPVGSTPTQGPAAQIPTPNAVPATGTNVPQNGAGITPQTGTTPGTTAAGTTTTGTTTPATVPPSSVSPGTAGQGEIGISNTATGTTAAGQAAGTSAGQSATMPPQTDVNRSLTPAQVLGTGNFGLTGSVWSVPANQQSLADASREAKQKLAKDRPRVFTNDDIARIRQAAGEPAVARPGTTPGLVTNEQTMPASDVTTPNTSPNNAPNNQNSSGVQNNVPASDQIPGQTTPPTNMNRNQRRPSPFRPK